MRCRWPEELRSSELTFSNNTFRFLTPVLPKGYGFFDTAKVLYSSLWYTCEIPGVGLTACAQVRDVALEK